MQRYRFVWALPLQYARLFASEGTGWGAALAMFSENSLCSQPLIPVQGSSVRNVPPRPHPPFYNEPAGAYALNVYGQVGDNRSAWPLAWLLKVTYQRR